MVTNTKTTTCTEYNEDGSVTITVTEDVEVRSPEGILISAETTVLSEETTGGDNGDEEEIDPDKVKTESTVTTETDKDGNKKVTTVTTSTTDNGDCTETIVVRKRVEKFTPEPESISLGFIEGVVSEETVTNPACEEDEEEEETGENGGEDETDETGENGNDEEVSEDDNE